MLDHWLELLNFLLGAKVLDLFNHSKEVPQPLQKLVLLLNLEEGGDASKDDKRDHPSLLLSW